jgi:hypothetical protein
MDSVVPSLSERVPPFAALIGADVDVPPMTGVGEDPALCEAMGLGITLVVDTAPPQPANIDAMQRQGTTFLYIAATRILNGEAEPT